MDGRRDIESRLRQSWSVADWWWPLEGHENSEHRKLIGRFAFIVFFCWADRERKARERGNELSAQLGQALLTYWAVDRQSKWQ